MKEADIADEMVFNLWTSRVGNLKEHVWKSLRDQGMCRDCENPCRKMDDKLFHVACCVMDMHARMN